MKPQDVKPQDSVPDVVVQDDGTTPVDELPIDISVATDPIPAGTQGIYSGTLQGLLTQLDTASNIANGLKSRRDNFMNQLQKQIDTSQLEVGRLQTLVDAVNQKLGSLPDRVDPLPGPVDEEPTV